MLAVQLQLRRVPFRLIEAREGRDYKVKAMGITPRTLEIFDQMGILDEALGLNCAWYADVLMALTAPHTR